MNDQLLTFLGSVNLLTTPSIWEAVAFVFDAGEKHCSNFFLISSRSTFLFNAILSRNCRYSEIFKDFFVLNYSRIFKKLWIISIDKKY